MTLPYDKSRLPTGLTEKDVRTFYYDESLKRWEQVGLLAENDSQMAAVTEHFTDFVNATIPMPEHPGTQSINPTSLKDIKLADPAASHTPIQPPTPSPTGLGPIAVPHRDAAGSAWRLQPDLDIAYDSGAQNGWLGVGWNLKTSSIEVDTRFGVPHYATDEVYMLDGSMLTPCSTCGAGNYQRRSETTFDIIQRIGSDPTSYSWKVTDKNGDDFYLWSRLLRAASPTRTRRTPTFLNGFSKAKPTSSEIRLTLHLCRGQRPEWANLPSCTSPRLIIRPMAPRLSLQLTRYHSASMPLPTGFAQTPLVPRAQVSSS